MDFSKFFFNILYGSKIGKGLVWTVSRLFRNVLSFNSLEMSSGGSMSVLPPSSVEIVD